ncbi:hypothetical protein BCR39DRAFT_567610 [Naematelia encephala]|uniref:Nucleosome assembly protein n=1 Tax=Naematelia encephala TaxID=71784 RepID=A0A1Y2BMN7_9TREE|nr:hypothetical protein BCR39DRAFT_567610 [Naematelia encephala]
MSQSQQINQGGRSLDVAPTPQNTPLDTQVLANRPANLGKPQVEDIGEGEEEDDGAEDVSSMNPASLLAKNPALLALAQHKFDQLLGKSSGYIESLPPPVRRRIDGLKGIQVEHSKIENEFQLAILDLEKKFLTKYEPLYQRRQEIIAGKAEPTEEEIETGKNADSDDEDEDEDEQEGAHITSVDDEKKDESIKGIPEFWLTALKNHAPIAETISDRDEEVLKLLQDVRLSYLEEGQPGFKLHFKFAPNDYFEDTELTKTYYYQAEVGYGGDFVYDKAVGQQIKWKEDKDLTKKVEIKKQRNKTTGRTRVVRKVVPTDSFFAFFSPPQPPTPETLEQSDVDEDELEELDGRLEADYQIGEDFKEKIIPRAVDYFTGKALRYEDDFEDEEVDEFDEEDDFDDDDDDEDNAAQADAAANPECKQQ